MRNTSAIWILAAIAFVIVPVHADAQSNIRRVQVSRPLVLRVTPRGFYRSIPIYLIGTTYVPRSAFDPIPLAAPLGPSANNPTIVLPVSSASCSVSRENGKMFASFGCLAQ
ncbi:hypothetical protein AB4097_20220 [Microvirga sp. 2MCAF35]|uniref:hypothetical protein n=1 Tax=Microvirga sp. 2MCAF35 TaxID=3232987 RepID=UPI003F989465